MVRSKQKCNFEGMQFLQGWGGACIWYLHHVCRGAAQDKKAIHSNDQVLMEAQVRN